MTYKSTTVLISIIKRSACILLRFYVYTEQKDFNDKGEESYGGARGGIRGNSDPKFVMLFGVAVIIVIRKKQRHGLPILNSLYICTHIYIYPSLSLSLSAIFLF